MFEIKVYNIGMQQDIENFFAKSFLDLGWEYEPYGEHSDILNINDVYMKNGCMWCMYGNNKLIGTVAVRVLDIESKNVEIKRLFVLKEFQGNGYGNMLFKTALNYVEETKFKKIYADTAKDRDVAHHILNKYGFVKTSRYADCSQYTELFFELEIL
jgi:predicted GNAT family N-acyltransferase